MLKVGCHYCKGYVCLDARLFDSVLRHIDAQPDDTLLDKISVWSDRDE